MNRPPREGTKSKPLRREVTVSLQRCSPCPNSHLPPANFPSSDATGCCAHSLGSLPQGSKRGLKSRKAIGRAALLPAWGQGLPGSPRSLQRTHCCLHGWSSSQPITCVGGEAFSSAEQTRSCLGFGEQAGQGVEPGQAAWAKEGGAAEAAKAGWGRGRASWGRS